ncbi:hypothetical protein QYF36_020965 [Acer negundo]|nr:hypothetical protein QYF36_020965 [Acer negundo]
MSEPQSLIEELSASHSTDLQQRAYELQVVIGLDASAVQIIMPSDASCEDIEATLETKTTMKLHQCKVLGLRHMSFPYLRCHQGFLQFPLRRLRNLFQYLSHPSLSNADPSELRLRLDGVQKMWGGKASRHVAEKPQTTKAPVKTAVEKIVVQPPPNLIDLGEPTVVSSSPPSVDPFKQLEELIESTQVTSSVNHDANKSPDLMGLYVELWRQLGLDQSADYLIGNGSNFNKMGYKENAHEPRM